MIPLRWVPAAVGCYWESLRGDYHISTVVTTQGTDLDSLYRVARGHEEIGKAPNLKQAMKLASVDYKQRTAQ